MVRKLKDRTRSRFNLAVTEVGGQDTWQRIEIGFALVGNDRAYVDNTVEKVVRFIEGMAVAEVVAEERDTLHYGESLGSGSGAGVDSPDGWVPAEWLEEVEGGDGNGEVP